MSQLKEIENRYYKECKVIMLPTDNKANIFKQTHTVLYGDPIYNSKLECSFNQTYINNAHLMSSGKAATNSKKKYQFYNIYITSNDEIKEGDYVYYNGKVRKASSKIIEAQGNIIRLNWVKIIATTDKSLFFTGYNTLKHSVSEEEILPQPSQSFIKDYCELGGIDKVLVEYDTTIKLKWL